MEAQKAGIDKLKIWIPFDAMSIKDHSIFDEIRQPSIKRGNQPESKPLFYESDSGKVIHGTKAFRNEINSEGLHHFSINLEAAGMAVEWNPSKLHHNPDSHIHPITDDATLAAKNDSVFSRLAELGIDADFRQAHIGRIDICRNMMMEHDCHEYLPAYNYIKLPYMLKDPAAYHDGIRYASSRRTLNLYNKGREAESLSEPLRKQLGNKLLRIESQFKVKDAVKAAAKVRNIAELEDNGISMQQELWKKYLNKQIFKLGKVMDSQQYIPYQSAEELFAEAQSKFGKNFFFKTILACMPNLEEFIQQIGHKRNIEDLLFDLIGREGRRKLIAQLDEILAFSREMKLSRVKSLDLYQELHRKAVA